MNIVTMNQAQFERLMELGERLCGAGLFIAMALLVMTFTIWFVGRGL